MSHTEGQKALGRASERRHCRRLVRLAALCASVGNSGQQSGILAATESFNGRCLMASLALPLRHHAFASDRAEKRQSPRRIAGELVLGAAGLAIGGFALYFLRERTLEEAEHSVLERDGAFSLRRYGRLVTAQVQRYGPLVDALDEGYRPLAGYISAKRDARQPARTTGGSR
jgi:hypothetical protein